MTPLSLSPTAADMRTPAHELDDETLVRLHRGEASDTERLEELRTELMRRLGRGEKLRAMVERVASRLGFVVEGMKDE